MHIEQKTNRIFKPQTNTTLAAEESNQVTTELENLITAGTLTPSAGTLTQVRDAVNNIVGAAANNLQSQIDAITAASDVFDVVGTYAQLQAYDKSTVPVNDIIKVLQDSTHNNAATYYRLEEESGGGTDWTYIGQEGPYYTKSEIDADFATKAELPGIATNAQVGLVKPDGVSVTVQADGTLNVSSNVAASLPLFTTIWADHILNNASYLRADTFSWQSGSVYTSAYAHLVADIDDIASETETIAGTTITFYRAADGHKIVEADQESNVEAIYTATGIAWYYILDTDNTRFKLPRTKWAFIGYRDSVGNYEPETLPNITGKYGITDRAIGGSSTGTSALYASATGTSWATWQSAGAGGGLDISFDASRSSSTYKNGANVRQRATQMYLYFYVGNTVQNQTEIDVGEITEALNDKVDLDGSWGAPTNQYDDLTLGASDTEYTAPADGWFAINKTAGSANLYLTMANQSNNMQAGNVYASSGQFRCYIPAKKGDKVVVYYSMTGTTNMFRFIYAQKTN